MANYRRFYADNHYIFITIVTYNRDPILIDNADLLKTSFKTVKNLYSFEIFGIVIMPDHFHMIIKPGIADELPKIIGNIKRDFTKSVGCALRTENALFTENIPASRLSRREKTVWQRRFYEHTIRNEDELYKYLNYIHYNPIKHGYVKRTKDWKLSSFHKFVEKSYYDVDWGNIDDIKDLKDMDFE